VNGTASDCGYRRGEGRTTTNMGELQRTGPEQSIQKIGSRARERKAIKKGEKYGRKETRKHSSKLVLKTAYKQKIL
jgi:hypothetical protein